MVFLVFKAPMVVVLVAVVVVLVAADQELLVMLVKVQAVLELFGQLMVPHMQLVVLAGAAEQMEYLELAMVVAQIKLLLKRLAQVEQA
jgi:hypothetical protein